jgi:ferrochelatase
MTLPARDGLLLVNLGTPDSPAVTDVRRYLREFLSDPRIIDIPAALRRALLEVVILPRRPRRSAEAYASIWTAEGSPLLVHGRALQARLAERLGDGVRVELAMRYGQPRLRDALARLRAEGVRQVVVLPLFPQYSAAAWGSAVAAVYRAAHRHWDVPPLAVVPPFFDDPGFLAAQAARARPVLDELAPERVVISFHGLPVRQVLRSDVSGRHCLASGDCCERPGAALATCYRAQCLATARGIANALGLPDDRWEATFQSRLGRAAWLEPYTDVHVRELAGAGVRRLAVLCPSFVADCLETLEEIGLRADEDFRAAGGERLVLVPSLNAEPEWVEVILQLASATGLPAAADALAAGEPA